MFKKKGLPVKDELVICTIKRLDPHSAFAELNEYEGVNGMIHISEIALRGVKSVKNHLSVGKRVVCKVMSVKDGVADLSLKRVSSGARKEKLNEHRINKRFYHLVEHACNDKTKTDKIMQSFIDSYGSINNAYDALKDKGLKFLNKVSIPKPVELEIKNNFKSLLKQLKVKISRTISVSSRTNDGVVRIKKLLTSIKPPKNVSVEFLYQGAGNFLLSIEAMNYKIAEDYLDELLNHLVEAGKKQEVLVSFSD